MVDHQNIAATTFESEQNTGATRKKPTKLFIGYAVKLFVRFVIFAIAVWLLFTDRTKLDPAHEFGITHGLSFVNIVFLIMIFDGLTKLFPHAKIAMGSLKQYRSFHAPTAQTFMGGRDAMVSYVHQVFDDGTIIAHETAEGVRASVLGLMRDADIMRLLPWEEEDLTADQELRHDIGQRHLREILPVIIFWVVFNAAIALGLAYLGWLTAPVALVWTLFYFLSDMICMVFWCPLQLFMMHNRCCTTCQIFNWDAIMAATPLIFVGGWFSWIIIGLALVVLVRWELAFARYPERFDERTNASLRCANCQDTLCYLRPPLIRPDQRM